MLSIRAAVVLVSAVLLLPASEAGELGLTADPVSYPHPITYNVRRIPDLLLLADGLATPSVVLTVADNCTSADYAMTAVGHPPGSPPLESALSASISSIARPIISSVEFNDAGVDRITGDNYPMNVKVYVDGVESLNVTRVSCQVVEIPTTPGTPASIQIVNEGPNGNLSVTWSLPPPMPPTGVTVH